MLFLAPAFAFSQSANKKKTTQKSLSKYAVQMDKNTKEVISVPQTEPVTVGNVSKQQIFNTYYSNYLSSEVKNKDFNSLLKAHELAPANTELYFELAKFYELEQNNLKKREFCNKLKLTKLSPALREYANNTLMSVEQGGILVTYGEDDTYPIWILQLIEGVRKDVKILNYDLMVNETYRKAKTEELGLRFSKNYSQPIQILKDLATKNKSKNIYYSLTVSHLVLKDLKKDLYPTGLALKYSNKTFDNSQILSTNWHQKFSKSYISNSLISPQEKKLNINYVLPLLQLSSFYSENGNELKEKEINTVIRKIGLNGGKAQQIESLLKK